MEQSELETLIECSSLQKNRKKLMELFALYKALHLNSSDKDKSADIQNSITTFLDTKFTPEILDILESIQNGQSFLQKLSSLAKLAAAEEKNLNGEG